MSKVSIMVPTYNQSYYIEQCLNSALAQDYENIEIIISDDSTDSKTQEIIERKYINNPKVKYFHNKPSLGRVQNYYVSLNERATGQYVMNLDGDDFLINEHFISKAISFFKDNNELVAVFANEKIYNESQDRFINRLPNSDKFQIVDGKDVYLNRVKMRLNFYHLSTLYKRESAINAGFYEEDLLGSDTISLMKILLEGKVAFIEEFAGAWRVHDNNDSFVKNVDIMIANINVPNILYEYVKGYNLTDSKTLNEWRKNYIFAYFERYFFSLISNHEYKLAYNLILNYKKKYKEFFIETFLRLKFYMKFILALIGRYK